KPTRPQVRPATLMVRAEVAALAVGGPWGRWGPVTVVVTAVSAGASAAGTVSQNTYWTGTACCPGGGGGRDGEAGAAAAEVIVTRVPVVRWHMPGLPPPGSMK